MTTTLPNIFFILGEATPNPLGGSWVLPIVMIIVFWVVLIRPQQKQRKETAARQAAIKKGDKVITVGGMHATVNAVSEKTVSLKIADGMFVKYDKTSIATVSNYSSAKTEPTKKQEDK